jgi:hypothetical protein
VLAVWTRCGSSFTGPEISLWEIAMLVGKGRLDPGTDSASFCRLALDAWGLRVLPITPAIALASIAPVLKEDLRALGVRTPRLASSSTGPGATRPR